MKDTGFMKKIMRVWICNYLCIADSIREQTREISYKGREGSCLLDIRFHTDFNSYMSMNILSGIV